MNITKQNNKKEFATLIFNSVIILKIKVRMIITKQNNKKQLLRAKGTKKLWQESCFSFG